MTGPTQAVPQIERSMCLRSRCRSFRCSRCVDACPPGALSFEDVFAVRHEACTGCMLCASACPAEALVTTTGNIYETACFLAPLERPVLGCRSMADTPAHHRVACLGQLSEEQLAVLAHLLPQGCQLNACRCGDCEARDVLATVRSRLARAAASGLLEGAGRLRLIEKKDDLGFSPRSFTRREFLRSFHRERQGNVPPPVLVSAADSRRSRKRMPLSRSILLSILPKLPDTLLFRVEIDDSCSTCPKCAAMCPTGALRRTREGRGSHVLRFDPGQCVGCDLCAHFCPSQSLRLLSPAKPEALENPVLPELANRGSMT